jgi:hypothetical protein
MIEARGLVKRYGSAAAVDDPQFRRPARHGDRVPRAERRGQVHHDADDPRPGPAGRRGGQDHGQNHRDLRWPLREVGSLLAEGLRRPVIFLSHSRDDSELASALSTGSRPGPTSAPDHNRTESLALAPLGKLGVQRRYGSLGSGGQQMPVHLVSDVDVPVPEEVG